MARAEDFSSVPDNRSQFRFGERLDVPTHVRIPVKWIGLRAVQPEHHLLLLLHAKLVPRPSNHLAQRRAWSKRMGFRRAVERDGDFQFLAPADMDAFVFAVLKAAVVSRPRPSPPRRRTIPRVWIPQGGLLWEGAGLAKRPFPAPQARSCGRLFAHRSGRVFCCS